MPKQHLTVSVYVCLPLRLSPYDSHLIISDCCGSTCTPHLSLICLPSSYLVRCKPPLHLSNIFNTYNVFESIGQLLLPRSTNASLLKTPQAGYAFALCSMLLFIKDRIGGNVPQVMWKRPRPRAFLPTLQILCARHSAVSHRSFSLRYSGVLHTFQVQCLQFFVYRPQFLLLVIQFLVHFVL